MDHTQELIEVIKVIQANQDSLIKSMHILKDRIEAIERRLDVKP